MQVVYGDWALSQLGTGSIPEAADGRRVACLLDKMTLPRLGAMRLVPVDKFVPESVRGLREREGANRIVSIRDPDATTGFGCH